MSRGALLLAAALAGAAEAAANAGPGTPPLCEASVSLDPERAHPGQQVLYRLRLLVRDDVSDAAWEEPPTFPGLRAERLAPEPLTGPLTRSGAVYQVRDDARALFADRPGSVRVPPARILCRARGPDGEVAERLATPAARLEVVALPEAGRPAAFHGLVGPLSLRRLVTPESVQIGQSVRLAVTLQGAGNLWDAPMPELSGEALGGAEVFRRPADVELDRGTRLLVRRRFVFDLVPRRQGLLQIPALAFAYYDPVAGGYAEASAAPVVVTVGPPLAAPVAGAERSGPAAGADAPAAPARAEPGRRALLVAGAALLLAALGAAGWLSWRRTRARTQPARAALARADAAHARSDRDGELAELARALRAALAAQSGAADCPPEAILASNSPRARRADELLDHLERARFDPEAEAPAREAILRALAELGVRPPERRV